MPLRSQPKKFAPIYIHQIVNASILQYSPQALKSLYPCIIYSWTSSSIGRQVVYPERLSILARRPHHLIPAR